MWVKLSLSSVLHCSDLSSLKTVKYFLHVLCLCVASMTIKSDLTAQFKGKTKTLQWPRVGWVSVQKHAVEKWDMCVMQEMQKLHHVILWSVEMRCQHPTAPCNWHQQPSKQTKVNKRLETCPGCNLQCGEMKYFCFQHALLPVRVVPHLAECTAYGHPGWFLFLFSLFSQLL